MGRPARDGVGLAWHDFGGDGAAHDLHLDRPVQWQRAVTEFLGSLESAPT